MAEAVQEVRPPEPPPKPPEVPRQTEPRADQSREDGSREHQAGARDETAAALKAEHSGASGDDSQRSLADGKDSLRPTPEFKAGLDQARAAKDERAVRAEGATIDPPSSPDAASQRRLEPHEGLGHPAGAQAEDRQAAGHTAAHEYGEASESRHDRAEPTTLGDDTAQDEPEQAPAEPLSAPRVESTADESGAAAKSTSESEDGATQETDDQTEVDQTGESDADAERTDKIHSRYPDGAPVYEGEQPEKIREPDPAAEGAPHTVLKMDTVNDRVYKAREYGEGGVPVRDIDFTHPTYPNGTLRPDHTAPEQHRWIPNDPDNPRAGYKRGPGEPLDS